MRLSLVRAPGTRTPPGAALVLVAVARRLPPSWLRVQLVLAGDAELRRLNREFRGRDRATDVLSFRYDRSRAPAAAAPHAELYVSMQRARRQARAHRHPLAHEVVRLALHGMLHLQGHDHERAAQARRMRAAEERQLRWVAHRSGWRLRPLLGTPLGRSAERRRQE